MTHPTIISVLGNGLILAGFIFLGPLPFVQLQPSLAMIQTVYAFYAIGFALVRVSTLVRSQKAVLESGFGDNTVNNSFVTGHI